MENRKYIKIFILAGLLTLAIGCTDVTGTYSEYTKGGEQVYVGKLYGTTILPGYERVAVIGGLNYISNAQSLVISWDNGKGKEIVDISDKSNKDVIIHYINGLKEGNYVFDVKTIDGKGNRSVVTQHATTVYGPDYAAGMQPRTLESYNTDNNRITLTWAQSSLLEKAVLSYKNRAGEPQEVVVYSVSETGEAINSYVIDNFELGGKLKITPGILPLSNALDFIDYQVETFDFPEVLKIAALGLPSDAKPYSGSSLIGLMDGDPATYMHSNTGNGLPSHVTYDMIAEWTYNDGKILTRIGQLKWAPWYFQVWGLPDIGDGNIADYEPSVPDNLANSDQWEAESLSLGWINLTDVGGVNNYAVREPTATEATFELDNTTAVRYIRYRVLRSREWQTAEGVNDTGSTSYFCTAELILNK